ncbi:hypothetical protein TUE45_02779 [Streptomyces reticuli]|nr:hypothetical protein TUE45_02779 [Streptomyces reticuli]
MLSSSVLSGVPTPDELLSGNAKFPTCGPVQNLRSFRVVNLNYFRKDGNQVGS